ncbi:hypothetical protein BS78_02G203600 [Paspalum vaginatum]|nr:hypothetical protein BS78_02G203600 [Paspalum vaginatum]
MNSVVASILVVEVSVGYRLAPKHPLPAAYDYDDAWAKLAWALSLGTDPWLSAHGDLARVFLTGASRRGQHHPQHGHRRWCPQSAAFFFPGPATTCQGRAPPPPVLCQ